MRAPSSVVRGWSVPRWEPAAGLDVTTEHDEHINQRFAIWQGDITCLEVDAMTNTTDETMLECNAISSRVLLAAGPGLKEEIITKGLECSSPGAVCVSGAHRLPARHVLHVRCPDYSAAADAALHAAYTNVLMRASELGAKTLSLCLINTPRRNYPTDVAVHIALRAIRSWLERSRWPRLVVLCCGSASGAALAAALAHAHFPRTQHAPPERRIRIIHNPHTAAEDDTSLCDEDAAVEAAAAFARACDTQRLLAPADSYRVVSQHSDDHDQYERLLRRARSEDLSEVSGIGCLYQSGVDRLGRPVVVFIGKWFPIGEIDLDKALLYLIKLLDPLVRGDYVLVYFHTQASAGNHPPFSWLKEVYTVLPYKYKKNLKAFYIVHPTFWTKMMTWWFTTFMAPAIKAKVHTLPGIEYLYSVMARDQLEVPAFVTEYDMTINGLHYFQPDATSTNT